MGRTRMSLRTYSSRSGITDREVGWLVIRDSSVPFKLRLEQYAAAVAVARYREEPPNRDG